MSLLTIILANLALHWSICIFLFGEHQNHLIPQVGFSTWIKEELARPSVTSLFKNQGIYNALIGGVSLVWIVCL